MTLWANTADDALYVGTRYSLGTWSSGPVIPL